MSDDHADDTSRRGFLTGRPFRNPESDSPKQSSDDDKASPPAAREPAAREDARQNTSETRGPAVDLDAVLQRAEAMNGTEEGSGGRHARSRTADSEGTRATPLRPPGAVSEPEFRQRCTGCADCVSACPHDTITLLPDRHEESAGTPTVSLFDAPCHMCHDVPCIQACEPDALQFRPPVKIGVAEIQTHSCLAHNHNVCTVCVEHCPKPGAIRMEGGRSGVPVVDADACTGCGACYAACPAPGTAILIRPPDSRASE